MLYNLDLPLRKFENFFGLLGSCYSAPSDPLDENQQLGVLRIFIKRKSESTHEERTACAFDNLPNQRRIWIPAIALSEQLQRLFTDGLDGFGKLAAGLLRCAVGINGATQFPGAPVSPEDLHG